MSNPATIARGLTPAQRNLIRRGSASGDVSLRTVKALIGKGLMYIKADSPDGRWGSCILTEKGREVVAVLSRKAAA